MSGLITRGSTPKSNAAHPVYLGVLLEVVGRAIGAADALNPAVRRLKLAIPAVAGVVGHFCGKVLAEAKARNMDM